MSRKDYIALAAIIARHVYDLNDAGIALVAELTDHLEANSTEFDRDQFVNACVGLKARSPEFQIQPKTYAAVALDQEGRRRRCEK